MPPLRTTDLLMLMMLGDGPQHGYAIARAFGNGPASTWTCDREISTACCIEWTGAD